MSGELYICLVVSLKIWGLLVVRLFVVVTGGRRRWRERIRCGIFIVMVGKKGLAGLWVQSLR